MHSVCNCICSCINKYLYLQITYEHYQHGYVYTLCVIVDVFVFKNICISNYIQALSAPLCVHSVCNCICIYTYLYLQITLSAPPCVHSVCNCRCVATSLSSQFKRLLPLLLISLHIVHCTWHQPNSWETFIFCIKCEQMLW